MGERQGTGRWEGLLLYAQCTHAAYGSPSACLSELVVLVVHEEVHEEVQTSWVVVLMLRPVPANPEIVEDWARL